MQRKASTAPRLGGRARLDLPAVDRDRAARDVRLGGRQARVKPWLREGITWRLGDASDPRLVDELGSKDLVVANNFLCHMDAPTAERCLRNFARLASRRLPLRLRRRSGRSDEGRARSRMGARAGAHGRDPRRRPPGARRLALGWWGLEPLDRRRPDWQTRYAAVFRVREAGEGQDDLPEPAGGRLIGTTLRLRAHRTGLHGGTSAARGHTLSQPDHELAARQEQQPEIEREPDAAADDRTDEQRPGAFSASPRSNGRDDPGEHGESDVAEDVHLACRSIARARIAA